MQHDTHVQEFKTSMLALFTRLSAHANSQPQPICHDASTLAWVDLSNDEWA